MQSPYTLTLVSQRLLELTVKWLDSRLMFNKGTLLRANSLHCTSALPLSQAFSMKLTPES